MRFQGRCVVMFLVIYIIPSPTSTHLVVLSITVRGSSGQIGLGEESGSSFGTEFTNCVCDDKASCIMPSIVDTTYPESPSQVLTAEHAATYSGAKPFLCEFKQNYLSGNYEVSCTKDKKFSCSRFSCTIHIIITCPASSYVVLTWASKQTPRVLNSTDVTVIDCCNTATTTTEMTTTSTTLTTTNFTSTPPTAIPTTTTFLDSSTTTNVGLLQSTSPTPDIIPTNITHSETAQQQTETSDASSITSGQLIGIIVGTAVAAILITIVIICIFWKLKTRREKNGRNEQTDSPMQVSGNLGDTQVHNVRHRGHEGPKKTSKAIAHVSPLVQPGEGESHLSQSPGDYTYIDINSAASSKSNPAITSPSPAVGGNHQNSTTAEAVTEIQDSEYSHLGTCKVRLENLYNWLDHQRPSTAAQPVIIPALPINNRPHKRYLDTSDAYIRPTNHHTSQETDHVIGANENSSLYSNLGEPKSPRENTYNSLHGVNDEPITEPHFTQPNRTTNQNSEIRPDSIPSPNQKRDISPHTSQPSSMKIVDVSPCTYTEIIPKPKQEKSSDSSQLKDTFNQTKPTASSSDHPMPQEAKSLKALTEMNMTRGTVQGDKKNPKTEDEPGSAYVNAVYSMHESPQDDNTTFSLEAPDYANMA